jgi:fructose-1,6-bisphosphatase
MTLYVFMNHLNCRLQNSEAIQEISISTPFQIGLILPSRDLAGGFSVAFDPLDGSSIVDTNFTVGTIFGVWPGDKLTGVTGGDQVAAAMGIYGPRTTFVVALKDSPGTHEFLLLDEGSLQFRSRASVCT